MNQNRFDEINRQKIEIRKSAKKAEYKRKKQRKRRQRYGKDNIERRTANGFIRMEQESGLAPSLKIKGVWMYEKVKGGDK